jgi:hypothetical protein
MKESIIIETRVTMVLTRLGIENSLHMCKEVVASQKVHIVNYSQQILYNN